MAIRPRTDARYVVGVDLGGTNVRAAVVDLEGRLVAQDRRESGARQGARRVVEGVARTVSEAVKKADITLDDVGAVGCAVPGHIDPVTGVIHWSPNFGEERDGQFHIFLEVPFTEPVSETLGLAVGAGNDANVAALGEFRYGAGKDVDDMVMFTLGTGIGCGVVSSGRLVVGSTGGAVEGGHHVIVAGGARCGCGTLGCLEAYCGTDAILDRAARAIESNQTSLLFDAIATDKTTLTPKMIDDAARLNDPLAVRVFEETGYYLGIGAGNMVNVFNPALVVIGGGIRQATGLLGAAERSMRRHSIYSLAHTCRIVEATLGDDAGVMGAAELAWRMMADA